MIIKMSFKNKPSGSYYRKRSAQREVDRQKECGSLLKFLKVDQPEQPNQLDNEYEQSEMKKVDSSQVFDEETSDIDKTDDTIQVKSKHEENIFEKENRSGDFAYESSAEVSEPESDKFPTYIKDIGLWLRPIKDSLRLQLVEQGVGELQNKAGPFVEDVDERGTSRSLTSQWFIKTLANGKELPRDWLIYSPVKGAAFCFCCILFPHTQSGQGGTVSSFASQHGFSKWRKLNPRILDHEKSPYHRQCYLSWKELEAGLHAGALIDHSLEQAIQQERMKWREILKRVLDVILFVAKQNIALRGHREDDESHNRGNFYELILLLGKYDAVLREHLTTVTLTARSTSYLSPTIQNEVINLLGRTVHEKIVEDIKKAKYFTIIADSTPDAAHVDQMSIIVRYVVLQQNNVEVRESFFGFFAMKGKTAAIFTNQLLECFEQDNISIQDCRGLGFDNAATMSGIHTGVQTRIRELNPLAVFVPCCNHSLNLVGVHAAEVNPEVITFFGTLDRLFAFFSQSTGRWDVMKRHLQISLKRHADTRWSSKAEAVKPVFKQYNELIDCLEELRNNGDTRDTRSDAGGLLDNVMSFKFLVFLNLWGKVLPEIDRVQAVLQTKHLTLKEAAVALESLRIMLVEDRDQLAKGAVEQAAAHCEENGITIQERIRRRKKMHDELGNDDQLSTKQEYDRKVKEVIDALLQEITNRFSKVHELDEDFGFVCDVKSLLQPSDNETSSIKAKWMSRCKDLSKKYPGHLDDIELLEELLALGRLMRSNTSTKQGDVRNFSALDILRYISSISLDAFPNLVIVLQLFITISVSVATAERSFSKLKLLMNYLRTSMGQDRLSNLATLSIEHELASRLDYDDVINTFASAKARKINL